MREVKFWALAAPVRADNGITYTSFMAGRDGIKRVMVSDNGLVIAEREGADTLIVHGLAFGFMEPRPAESVDTSCAPAPSVLETPKPPATLECDICGGEFATKTALSGHKLNKHKEL